jgi:hypothetical protein
MVGEYEGHKGAVFELLNIEEKNKNSFAIISNSVDEKGFKYWIAQKKEGRQEYTVTRGSFDESGLFNSNDCKSKIIIKGANSPYLAYLNDKDNEIVQCDITFAK